MISIVRSLLLVVAILSVARGAADPLRLPQSVQPVQQRLELALDPAKDEYHGKTRIELRFASATNQFKFHARDLQLGPATIDGKPITLSPAVDEIVTATANQPLSPGSHILEITFTNDFNRDATGLYKVEVGGKPYLFTQMEPTFARRAFPCWDEPGFKIRWDIILQTPESIVTVANMPVTGSSTAVSSGTMKITTFGRTPPMPSYLIAICVGTFDSIAIPDQPIAGRFFTVSGQSALARLSANEVTPLLRALENYFGRPYPYPKLDHVAVPDFNFGAMENVGAITYSDGMFLTDEANTSSERHKFITMVIAHELAHMWFGNLVTMKWWDDLWLNEAFAEWLSLKIAQQVRPEFNYPIMSYQTVMDGKRADIQPSVKPIRRHFKGGDNMLEAVDALTYSKGQAILRMAEGWIGEEKFRTALQTYCKKFSWSNASAEDLWEALGEAGDPELADILRTFIEQPGMPTLRFRRVEPDKLEITQQRYRTITVTDKSDQLWKVPVVFSYGDRTNRQQARLLLTKDRQVFTVAGLDRANWVHPNNGESGYYSWSLAEDLGKSLATIPGGILSLPEKLGILDSLTFAVTAGDASISDAVSSALAYASDPSPEARAEAVKVLLRFHEEYAGESHREASAQLLSRVLAPMLKNIGFSPGDNEPPSTEPLRTLLLLTLGVHAENREVIDFCKDAARKQMDDPRSIPASTADIALRVAAYHADKKWADDIRSAFEKHEAPDVRARFLGALGFFRDPQLARASYDYGLSEQVRPSEFPMLFFGPRVLSRARFEWLSKNYDKVRIKVTEDFLPFLLGSFNGVEPADFAPIREFFSDPTRQTPMMEVELAKLGESIELEYALRERNQQSTLSVLRQ